MERDYEKEFKKFLETQTEAAISAKYPGYRTVIDNSKFIPNLETIDSPFLEERLGGPLYIALPSDPSLPAADIIFAQTKPEPGQLLGNTAPLIEGEVDTLGGGETDYHALYNGGSRLADAILAGGNTARLSGNIRSVYHPELVQLRRKLGKPDHPIQIIVTRGNINMDEQLMFNIPNVQVIVLTTQQGMEMLESATARHPQVELVLMENSDFKSAFRKLKSKGINHISIVGGRGVASEALEAGVVTGAHITTAKEPGGKPNTPFYTGNKKVNLQVVTKRVGHDEEAGITYEYCLISLT